MKTCNRCNVAEHEDVALAGYTFTTYIANPVNENGLCGDCQIEINKMKYDMEHNLKPKTLEYNPTLLVEPNGIQKCACGFVGGIGQKHLCTLNWEIDSVKME